MANTKKRRTAGPKTEVFAMRLDPKLKYMAELASRKQRRSLANFVEWAIEEALAQVEVFPNHNEGRSDAIAYLSERLWALDEADRVTALGQYLPDLMTYEEQLIWRVLREHRVRDDETNRTCRFMEGETAMSRTIRACWPQIKAYAFGEGSKEELDEALKREYTPFPPAD